MPPLKVYMVRSKRVERDDYNTTYEFSTSKAVASWLTERCKCHKLRGFHIINYLNGRVLNRHFNIMSIALDYYDIKARKVKGFPTDFVEGRIMQSQVM